MSLRKTSIALSLFSSLTLSGVSQAASNLDQELQEYKTFAVNKIDGLVNQTQQFVDYLNAGKIDEAKALYPLVRMNFEAAEPIAESFGDLDPRIDARKADLEPGEKWTGFHPIEEILWVNNTTAGTEKYSVQLMSDVKELRAKVSTVEVTPELMVQGAVDLLNEVSTSKVSGEEEIFSHTDLYDFQGNIDGAEKIFVIFKPKLTALNADLVKTLELRFAEVNQLLAAQKVDGKFKFYNELNKDEVAGLAEAVNKLGEPLAQMGIILG
ncbi:EfeM/EfeO family lipoprotein [Amphritea opalescens]|uniref:EfeM/EfeO family lipoprotein n=1 Tax=Amphritea opalescens TaxID=2490544 RepID=A0A430KSM8_9GAMM|nr:iron uptake system protein EfeO [Amphritea opalescens]RTE66468.1 EfeM/EfeO family lipoprotein [Amphritea opalescens]